MYWQCLWFSSHSNSLSIHSFLYPAYPLRRTVIKVQLLGSDGPQVPIMLAGMLAEGNHYNLGMLISERLWLKAPVVMVF